MTLTAEKLRRVRAIMMADDPEEKPMTKREFKTFIRVNGGIREVVRKLEAIRNACKQ